MMEESIECSGTCPILGEGCVYISEGFLEEVTFSYWKGEKELPRGRGEQHSRFKEQLVVGIS
jgi:hypothetical protein